MARKAHTASSRSAASRRAAVTRVFSTLTIEGALVAPAQLALLADAKAEGQSEEDYAVPRGLTLRDEIPRAFRIAQALWNDLGPGESASRAATVSFVEKLMRDVLAFADVAPASVREHEGRVHPVTLEALDGRVPVVVVPPAEALDRPSATLSTAGRRTSAALALQDWLNASGGALWGLACNGEKLRLVRDNPSLTRPAYIEADLRQMFEGEDLADFTALWLLLHSSRFGRPNTPPTDCALERWREAGQKAGVVARDRLRDGVEEALKALGTGFVAHPANTELRRKLEDQSLDLLDFHSLLLRLVYRLIFLLVAEDRNLLHAPDAPAAARQVYSEGYSLSRLRTRSAKRSSWDAHDDLWDGLQVTFAALARGESALGLPALGGLFGQAGLGALEGCALPNRALMAAVYRLAWLKEESGVQQVNWRDMETEELGSVYEALLELTPRLSADGRAYGFAGSGEAGGHERKTTSSYYTPDSLVQFLLDRALDPVLDKTEREADDPAEALLKLKIIDPACGSGHFLLSAARRIATRVGRIRAGGAASADDYRHALRDVVRACVHGVDRNLMAVELAKVALWIETVEPGKPLGFLDANVRLGDALLGVFDLSVLEKGIPDAAYEPLAGDDLDAARAAGKANRDLRDKPQGDLFGPRPAEDLARQVEAVIAMPEDDLAGVTRKAEAWERLHAQAGWGTKKLACDLYIAAFLRPKRFREGGLARARTPDRVSTTRDVWAALAGRTEDAQTVALAETLAHEARAFHWPLEFPAIMRRGGFDVVLGNPPWDTMSPDAKEFFSRYDPAVRVLAPSEQKSRIEELKTLPGVADEWDAYCRRLYTAANFFRKSGRYELFAEGNLGKGDFNVYRMFVELALKASRIDGRAAQFVPENLYNGANAAGIRKHLLASCRWCGLVGFENTRKVWFDIHSAAKFCLYIASPGGKTESIPAAFGVNSLEKLIALQSGLPLDIPVSLVEEFSPEAMAITEIAHPDDLAITRKLYARFPKFGAKIDGLPERSYAREIDMGNDREDFSTDAEGLPIYEGRMVEAFDHRAKAYVTGRGRAAVWRELAFGSPDKTISPQWRLPESDIPEKLGERWRRYRIGFCDVASPTNQRALVAAIIPPNAICGHKVPTIEMTGGNNELLLLILGIMNSFCLDFVARKKVALTMSFTLVDSLPLPRSYEGSHTEREIARGALRLAATGREMDNLWRNTAPKLGLDPDCDGPLEDAEQRRQLRTKLDLLIARDIFGLTQDEMRYLLKPADILGEEVGFETFGALERAELREFGRFLTRDLILEAWDTWKVDETGSADREAVTDVVLSLPPLHTLPDGAWAWQTTIQPQDRLRYAAQYVLGLMDTAIDGPHVRLIIAGLAEPALLTAWLSGDQRNQWVRLVGAEARPAQGVIRLRPAVNAAWRSLFETLITSGQLEEQPDGSWTRGRDFSPVGLQSNSADAQRTAFALQAIRAADLSKLKETVAAEDNVIWARFGSG